MKRLCVGLVLMGVGSPAFSQTTFDLPVYQQSVIFMSAKGASAQKDGADLVLTIPSVELAVNPAMAKGADVQYADVRFRLYRRGPDGKPQYVGDSDKTRDFKGTLGTARRSATLQNVKLTYPKGAKECADGCFVSLTAWVQYADRQSGSSSDNAEIKLK